MTTERGTRREQAQRRVSRVVAMQIAAENLRKNPNHYSNEQTMPKKTLKRKAATKLSRLVRRREEINAEIAREELRVIDEFRKDVEKVEKRYGITCEVAMRCQTKKSAPVAKKTPKRKAAKKRAKAKKSTKRGSK